VRIRAGGRKITGGLGMRRPTPRPAVAVEFPAWCTPACTPPAPSTQLVLMLARRLRAADLGDTAATLEDACDAERRVAALTISDREAIVRVREDGPGRARRAARRALARA
jgi:hypothetical protein